jgi:hypothetical protein
MVECELLRGRARGVNVPALDVRTRSMDVDAEWGRRSRPERVGRRGIDVEVHVVRAAWHADRRPTADLRPSRPLGGLNVRRRLSRSRVHDRMSRKGGRMAREIMTTPVAPRPRTPRWLRVDWLVVVFVCLGGGDVLQHKGLSDIELHSVLLCRIHKGSSHRSLWLGVHESVLL